MTESDPHASKASLLNQIAAEMQDAEQILQKIQAEKNARGDLATAYIAPRTPVEKQLAEIWAEMLGVDRVGVQDNFFDLGGHSMLATQILSRIRDAFSVDLSLEAIFTNTLTVEGLAAEIEKSQLAQADAGEIAEILKELDGLSDEEIKALLASRGGGSS